MAAATKIGKDRAPRNRTTEIDAYEAEFYQKQLVYTGNGVDFRELNDVVICGDAFQTLPSLEKNSFDLLFADPPYNLSKNFGTEQFRQTSLDLYEQWLESWIADCAKLMRPTASIYICGDWRSASPIQRIGTKYFKLQNRITWEREKGRGAKRNWKNAAEDIWFFTVSDDYVFNVDAVQLKRKVIAPYTENGRPKDWSQSSEGNFRLTHPSNLWTDLTVPFWSMSENTDHPTQKPEKLLAKIILASSNDGSRILDPFLGSGTTAVVAKKLNRKFVGIEADEQYCLLAQKRLALAENDRSIQGYADGVFWERNTLNSQPRKTAISTDIDQQPTLLRSS